MVNLSPLSPSRLIITVASIKFAQDIIIVAQFISVAAGMTIFYLFQSQLYMIYLGTGLIAFGYSSICTAVLSFAQDHLWLTDRATSMFAFIEGLVAFSIPLILSCNFERQPMILLHICATFIAISLISFILARIWILRDEKIFRMQTNDQDQSSKL